MKKNNKKYLQLKNFEEGGVTKFGWAEVNPNRKRSLRKILDSDKFIKIYKKETTTFLTDKDLEDYIYFSFGLRATDIYNKWGGNVPAFEAIYKKASLSYKNGDGFLFLKLCNLLVNNIDFYHEGVEYSIVLK